MIMSKISMAVAAVAMSLSAAGTANAFSIQAGDYKMSIDNYDAGTTGYGNTSASTVQCTTTAQCDAVAGITKAPGAAVGSNPNADTFGIFSISSITRISDNSVFFQKGAGQYLTGVFGNLMDYNVTTYKTGPAFKTDTQSVGGIFAIYANANDYSPAQGPTNGGLADLNGTPGVYQGITDTGVLFLKGVFSAGVFAAFGDTTTTYASSFSNANLAGAGQAFLDLTGGSAYSNFNTNSLNDGGGTAASNYHDMFLDVTYNDINGAASNIGWSVTSAGQIKGNAIPEPGALALVSLALLGAGVATRRRKD